MLPRRRSFNSKLVRLKGYGYSAILTSMVTLFQFQTGSIKSRLASIMPVRAGETGFNSKLVRLKGS